MTASATIPVADVTGAAPLASPTFSGTVTTGIINTGALSATSVTTPIYASTPQALTDAATIAWNPALGLNASVTLGGDRTLSFSTTPVAGAYGTLVVTQDGTGGRKLTLPSTTNKVLGSATSTSVALSAAPNAKDIVNFYYDGTNCYWNVGQGFGTAATAAITLTTTGTGAATLSGTTLNIPSVSSTVNAGSISGTVAVANGGTGATSISGLVKGNGSGAMTSATAGTDYLLPTGSAASLTNFPTFNQSTTGNAATATIAGTISTTLAVTKGGTGVTSSTGSGSVVLSASPAFTGTPTAVTQAVTDNSTALATTAFVKSAIRLNSDEFTATAAQTTFTFTTASSNTGAVQTPLSKPYMYINGTRIKNSAYTWTSGTTVTYVPANNNSYALVAGDRVQFDYAY